MKKWFIKWLREKLPQREVTPEIRKQIKAEYPGYHLQKNGGRKKKEVQGETDKI
jgi:ribosomal protein S6E (S10)